MLKRGYEIEVSEPHGDMKEIDALGNYSKSEYNATLIVGTGGVAPTVRENHGQVTGIVVEEEVEIIPVLVTHLGGG